MQAGQRVTQRAGKRRTAKLLWNVAIERLLRQTGQRGNQLPLRVVQESAQRCQVQELVGAFRMAAALIFRQMFSSEDGSSANQRMDGVSSGKNMAQHPVQAIAPMFR